MGLSQKKKYINLSADNTLAHDRNSTTANITNICVAINSRTGDNRICHNDGTEVHTSDDNTDGEFFAGFIDEFAEETSDSEYA